MLWWIMNYVTKFLAQKTVENLQPFWAVCANSIYKDWHVTTSSDSVIENLQQEQMKQQNGNNNHDDKIYDENHDTFTYGND